MKSTKIKLLTILSILMLSLVACNGMTDNEEGRQGEDTNNIEPTRYNANDNNERDTTLDRDRGNEARDNRGMNREDRDRTRDNDQYDVAEKAADKITDDIAEIDRAYVLKTKNNAYVAAGLNEDNNDGKMKNDVKRRDNDKDQLKNPDADGEELTDDVKKQITDIVKSVDKDIDNVYVSTNPDFFDLTNNYVDDVNDGKPVRGFFDQFGNMVERLFPQNKR